MKKSFGLTAGLILLLIALLLGCGGKDVSDAQQTEAVDGKPTDAGITEQTDGVPVSLTDPDIVGVPHEGTYSFCRDEWDLYKATFVSDSLLKIERWYRGNSYQDPPFRYKDDTCVINIGDHSTDFRWLDDSGSAFTVTMHDDNNEIWTEDELAGFSKDAEGEALPTYSYMHDAWNTYRAIRLSDTTVKIEKWYRASSSRYAPDYIDPPFYYNQDVGVFGADDLKWLDQSGSAFELAFIDDSNKNMEAVETVRFALDSGSAKRYVLRHDEWNVYKAIVLSDTCVKIEVWHRDSSYKNPPFFHDRDLCVIETSEPDIGFAWGDADHSAFSVFISDSENSEWKEPETVWFVAETADDGQ